jgi:hypothetical protein
MVIPQSFWSSTLDVGRFFSALLTHVGVDIFTYEKCVYERAFFGMKLKGLSVALL